MSLLVEKVKHNFSRQFQSGNFPIVTPSTILQTILFILLSVYLVRTIKRWFCFRVFSQLIDRLPGPPLRRFSPLGHVYLLLNNRKIDPLSRFFASFVFLSKMFEAQGHSLYRYWAFHIPVVVFFKADSVEKIFTSSVNIHKSMQYSFLKPLVGDGLIVSNGAKWAHRRKTIQPAFHFTILETYLRVMNEQAAILVDQIHQKILAESSKREEGTILNMVPLLTYAALDIIMETAMGVRLHSQTHSDTPYVRSLNAVSRNAMKRMHQPWWWKSSLYYRFSARGRQEQADLAVLRAFSRGVIAERKAEAEVGGKGFETKMIEKKEENEDHFCNTKQRTSFLDNLLRQHFEQPHLWTDSALQEEVETFMAAGHETSALTMTTALLLLANNPKVQEKLHAELDAFWAEEGLENHPHLTSVQIKKLKYLEAVVKETLRLFPAVPLIGRSLSSDLTVTSKDSKLKHLIPAGSTVLVTIYQLHRDPSVWPSPERFIPERFIDDGNEHYVRLENPFAYVPFAAGARNCVGQKFALQEAKILLATVLRPFRLEAVTRVEELVLRSELTLRTSGDIRARFVPRF